MKNLIFLFTSALCCFTSTTSFGQEQEINMFPKETFKYSIESKAVEEQPVVYRDITTTIAGSLAEKLGNEANTIDSLVVAGPINADDIRTLWDASFKGRLSVINLENAEIENGIVPEDAFWHQKEQLDPSGEFINTIHLRRIILPDGVKRIEECAFWHCDSLEQIVFPATLKMLGQESCSYISELKRIYCMASEPPVCEESTLNPGNTPFGDYEPVHNLSTPNDIPVYVPVGTAEKYRKAWGWDYFTNFIETDDFPTTGVDNITISPQKEEQIYD